MYKATFRFVGGYSRIDHLGQELARLAEENTKPCKTAQGAISNGRAALRRALEDHPVNSIRSDPPRVDIEAVAWNKGP